MYGNIGKLYVVSTTKSVPDGIDSNIPRLAFFKRFFPEPYLYLGNFKHLEQLSLRHVKIMLNMRFSVMKTPTMF